MTQQEREDLRGKAGEKKGEAEKKKEKQLW